MKELQNSEIVGILIRAKSEKLIDIIGFKHLLNTQIFTTP